MRISAAFSNRYDGGRPRPPINGRSKWGTRLNGQVGLGVQVH